ncbi:hypothetical protein TSUD_51040 [Trifolium subterraneum]|uniref:Uncharacterized protein n=1 Tax=Trifolium subterraneum TaxID=3900 RepID=A0A2Z6MNZ2_TRISU|nr:hypothetical protein TSUD_51040 [Trifolium subterraneum]
MINNSTEYFDMGAGVPTLVISLIHLKGRVELPSYPDDLVVSDADKDPSNQIPCDSKTKHSDNKRKKTGIPWTEEEHRVDMLECQNHGESL